MFKKILIANRGEIAVRIHRTAHRMGIKTVAVYSDADKYSRHVQICDEAVHIGKSPPKESYLVVDKIVDACQRTGAEAVHPGYGFLSERANAARALKDAGITFIGPAPDVIHMMGDKILANRQAAAAGVPTVPGYWDAIPDADKAAEIAAGIGYPVMMKAAAGGGGKGIRIAMDEGELRDAFRLASSEALSAFGDARVFIEKFIVNPRHIEIQVLGDTFGHVIHLGERECSIQRRHQKVIEESPSPIVDQALRQEMGARAVALAKSVNYSSAGTLEFIMDQERNYYFLEMNTRLQVEHSVTEFTSGLDLVEWMIRIAAGEKLAIRQENVQMSGWAVEARIYAEDPNRRFMPSIGRLVRYRTPEEGSQVRLDNGVYEGGEISMFYDPMIAKVTTWDRNRPAAVALMRRALDEFYIKGVQHNIAFLTALMANPRFLEGRLSTNFIAEEYPNGFSPAPLEEKDVNAIVAAGFLMYVRHLYRASHVSSQMPGYHRKIPVDWEVTVNDKVYPVKLMGLVEGGPEAGFEIMVEDALIAVRSDWQVGDHVLRCEVNGIPQRFKVEPSGLGFKLFHLGAEVEVVVHRKTVADLLKLMPERKAPDMSKYLVSPMPGLLRSISAEVGDKVEPGVELAVVEAMKMENILRSTCTGRITKVHAKAGDTLAVGQVIVEFE